MTAAATPIVLTVPEIIADPDGVWADARKRGDMIDSELGPMVVRYEALRGMLQDPRMIPNFPSVLEMFGVTGGTFYDFMARSPLNVDGDDHRRWRQLMARTFTPRSVDQLRPYLQQEGERLLAGFIEDGGCEFIDAYARQLPSLGLCELVGVPKQDRAQFCVWSDTMGLGFNPVFIAQHIHEVDEALEKLLAYSFELVRERKRAPQDDLVSRMAALIDDPEAQFDETAAATTVAGLVFAGHETTKNQLGWMLVVLADAPEEWDRVAAEPERAKAVVEEVLRLRSAAASIGRTTTVDMEVGGRMLPAGTRLGGSLWSANRDAQMFASPGKLDPDGNRSTPQIAFGQGPHHCLGAALARAELQESLVTLAQRITCPQIEDGAEFWPPIGITGPTRLPIRFEKR